MKTFNLKRKILNINLIKYKPTVYVHAVYSGTVNTHICTAYVHTVYLGPVHARVCSNK